MWFLVFITYWAISAGEAPLIEQLPNEAFTASSHYPHANDQDYCSAKYARKTSPDGWCALVGDANQYLQVDLGEEHTISAISTLPRVLGGQYVKTYTLSYSSDGQTFEDYGTTFTGNQQAFTGDTAVDEVVNELDPTIDARFLRFEPQTFSAHVSMRVEAYGSDVMPVNCESLQVDDFLSTCSVLFQSNVDGIRAVQEEVGEVNGRLDEVITRLGTAWADLSSANTIPINNYDMLHMDENKNWFNKYRDELIVLSLALNIIIGCALVALCLYINKKKYESYQRVKYVDSSDNENFAINK